MSNFTSIDKNLHIYNRRKEVNGSKIWQEEKCILQIQFRCLSRSQFCHQDHNWLLCTWTNGRHKICNNIWWEDKQLPGKVTMNKFTIQTCKHQGQKIHTQAQMIARSVVDKLAWTAPAGPSYDAPAMLFYWCF